MLKTRTVVTTVTNGDGFEGRTFVGPWTTQQLLEIAGRHPSPVIGSNSSDFTALGCLREAAVCRECSC